MNEYQKKETNKLIYSEWKKWEKFDLMSTDPNTPDSDRPRLRRVAMEHFQFAQGMLQVVYILGLEVKNTDDDVPQIV